MARELTFVCPLPNGLHARPASHLAEVAGQFVSEIVLSNARSGRRANAKSVLDLVGADVLFNDPCTMTFSGSDEQVAWREMSRFIKQDLRRCDEPLPAPAAAPGARSLPRMLAPAARACWRGVAVSSGIGRGRALILQASTLPVLMSAMPGEGPAVERGKIERAVEAVRSRLEGKLASPLSKVESEIVKAHLAIARDPALAQRMLERVDQQQSAGQAIVESARAFSNSLRESASVYLRERAVDVQDVCLDMLRHLYGDAVGGPGKIGLTGPSVLVAENLSPQQLLELDRAHLRGIVLGHAGQTSHTVILARSLGIPMLVGLPDAVHQLTPGQEVIVDANLGILVVQITALVQRYYALEEMKLSARAQRLARVAGMPGKTADGVALRVQANVGSVEEVAAAMKNGAEGVGLFRTEMLFIQERSEKREARSEKESKDEGGGMKDEGESGGRSTAHPTESALSDESGLSEEEQFQIYSAAVRAAGGRAITFRTLDVGGDKPLPWLSLGNEANPFLGYRGVRIYAEHADIFDAQVRAMLRASVQGPVRIMAPMIANVEEAKWVQDLVQQIRTKLMEQGIPFDSNTPVGMMVEVPSVALAIGELAQEAEFFSIGTNDLSQYFFAADRDNAKVAALASTHQPAFVRLLKMIADGARAGGRKLSMCGEMAGDIDVLPLLVGLGLDEISLAGAQIPAIKERLSQLKAADCRQLLETALACRDSAGLNDLLAKFRSRLVERPLLDRDLMLLDCDCAVKEEAIKRLVDLLHVTGRTDRPDLIERAVWAREEAFSTGLGFHFALPHCKTDYMLANSICLMRLRMPMAWSAGEEGVRIVLLLAVRATDPDNSHMRILARLARKMMNKDFRRMLMELADPEEAVKFLQGELA